MAKLLFVIEDEINKQPLRDENGTRFLCWKTRAEAEEVLEYSVNEPGFIIVEYREVESDITRMNRIETEFKELKETQIEDLRSRLIGLDRYCKKLDVKIQELKSK